MFDTGNISLLKDKVNSLSLTNPDHQVQPILPVINQGTPVPVNSRFNLKVLEYKTDNLTDDIKSATSQGFNAFLPPRYLTDSYATFRKGVVKELKLKGLGRKATRWDMCGTAVRYKCGCGHIHFGKFSCGLRTCPECADKTARSMYRQFKEVLTDWKCVPGWKWKHITLTTINNGGNGRELIKRMKRGQARVRRYFKETYGKDVAGIGGLEFGDNGMIHFHLAVYVPWLNRDYLWKKVWRLGFISIKTLKSNKQLLNVVSYAIRFFKGDKLLITPEQAVSYEIVLKGFRRIFTFGRLYGRVRVRAVFNRYYSCPNCGKVVEGCLVDGFKFRLLC